MTNDTKITIAGHMVFIGPILETSLSMDYKKL